MELQPNCAVCNAPAYPECPHESERLNVAIKQSEQRMLDHKLTEIRDWVVEHARVHILHLFKTLSNRRKQAHAAYLSSLPNYSIYMQYSGRPPLHPHALSQLQSAIADAHAELKHGIDADWKAAVVRYPEVLDYFYGLVDFRTPSERASSVVEPNFITGGGWPAGGSGSMFGGSEKDRRKKRHSRDSQREHGPPVAMDRPMPQRRMSTGGYGVGSGRPKAPPMAPMPPMPGRHQSYGASKGGGMYYGY